MNNCHIVLAHDFRATIASRFKMLTYRTYLENAGLNYSRHFRHATGFFGEVSQVSIKFSWALVYPFP